MEDNNINQEEELQNKLRMVSWFLAPEQATRVMHTLKEKVADE
jgi:hypothetical protein